MASWLADVEDELEENRRLIERNEPPVAAAAPLPPMPAMPPVGAAGGELAAPAAPAPELDDFADVAAIGVQMQPPVQGASAAVGGTVVPLAGEMPAVAYDTATEFDAQLPQAAPLAAAAAPALAYDDPGGWAGQAAGAGDDDTFDDLEDL